MFSEAGKCWIGLDWKGIKCITLINGQDLQVGAVNEEKDAGFGGDLAPFKKCSLLHCEIKEFDVCKPRADASGKHYRHWAW